MTLSFSNLPSLEGVTPAMLQIRTFQEYNSSSQNIREDRFDERAERTMVPAVTERVTGASVVFFGKV